jgi:hypothetical protein
VPMAIVLPDGTCMTHRRTQEEDREQGDLKQLSRLMVHARANQQSWRRADHSRRDSGR